MMINANTMRRNFDSRHGPLSLDTPATQPVVLEITASVAGPATNPAAATAAAAPPFGLVFSIDLLLLFLLLRWLRCSARSLVQAGRASFEQEFAGRLESDSSPARRCSE